jgi:hypothetical protein
VPDSFCSAIRDKLKYSPQDGRFTWKVAASRRYQAGRAAGSINGRGYRGIMIEGKWYAAHRLAWLYVYGQWPSGQIDHINGVRDDNRIANLRDVGQEVNLQNHRQARASSKTGLLGVSAVPGDKFIARIKSGGVKVHLGTFATADDAHAAYVLAKRALHPGCTI